MSTSASRASSTWVLALAISATACGAASKEASSPYTAPEPRTLDEAEAQLAAAEQDLGTGHATTVGEPAGATAPAAAPASPTTTPPAAESDERVEAEPGSASGASEDVARSSACETPCRAIASMRNAVRAICRIAGEADPKCTEAKGKLTASESRVATCGC